MSSEAGKPVRAWQWPPTDEGYRLLFQRHPWPMWVYDSETLRFLAVNEAAVAVYGWSEAEFLAMGLADIRPPQDHAELLNYLAQPQPPSRSLHSAARHWRHQRRNGEQIDVEVASEQIQFNGRQARLVLAKDITQRLRAEAALRDSERRYRSIVETASEGIWMIDAQALTTFVNPTMAQMLGYTAEQMVGRPLTDFMDAQGAAIAEANLERRRLGVSEQHDFCFRRRDGSTLWTSVSTNPVHDDSGAYAGALAMVTDISERRRSEARDAGRDRVMTLLVAGAPLATVLQAIVQGLEATWPEMLCSVLLLERSGNRLRNGAAPSLPAFFNEAVDGLAVGADMGCCGAAAASARRQVAEDLQTDLRWVRWRDLTQRAGLAACWSEPILSHAGAVLGTFGVYHRQLHRPAPAELAAVAEAAKMAAIAIERKQADDALREVQKMESLGTLAGGIAHDFNNILGAILGNLALAQHDLGAASSAAVLRLDQIRQSAQRARHLVQQLLAFSRRQVPQAVCQPLRPLIEEALGLLRASLPARVRLSDHLPAQPLPAEVDGPQLQQVLMNLCTNAWQAMPATGGEIQVGLEPVQLDAAVAARLGSLAPGPFAHLWVRDNGAGIAEAIRARIFEPFFTTKAVGTGAGLGLAVVHGIVSEHRGSIVVDSAPGRGATFHLYFPAADGRPAAPAGAPRPEAAAAPPGPGALPRILCVDDDPVMLLTNEGLLQRCGCQVLSVGGGVEALAVLADAAQAFDLIVTDYNMPEVSGIDLAREARRLRPGLPVLICSGYIDAELRERAAQLDVLALVPKANVVEELALAVHRVLRI